MSESKSLRMPPPLPADINDWTRHIKAERTLNDLVEDIHRVLVEDPKVGERYRELLRATTDPQSVEGSLSMDNALVAQMIRQRATDIGSEVAKEKLASINLSLGVVLRRYKASRKQRRNMVGGEEVRDDNGE